MNRARLLQRFLRYVQVDSTAQTDTDGYPSSAGQLELGRMLVEELHALGIEDARQDEHGIVLATLRPTVERACPTIAYCAHLDTSPETSGKDVKPRVIEDYRGNDIVLPGDCSRIIQVAENPELSKMVGRTLITSDGTTLLGADDKAGVAVIMETAAWLQEHPEIKRGTVRLCFTCDEEVGRGVQHLDLDEVGAAVCYTLDGEGTNKIDVETFSADLAEVTIHGINIHPSIAKGRMTNALRVAADFLSRLPRDGLAPEATEGREGFLHPYEVSGGVGEVKLRILLRDFQNENLMALAHRLRETADQCVRQFPAARIHIDIKRQYRNMAEGLSREPRAVAYAEKALTRLGRRGERTIVRGGTDGSRLTELGLPTPNLSCGAHTPHSRLEWACLDEMAESVEWLVALAEVWAEETP